MDLAHNSWIVNNQKRHVIFANKPYHLSRYPPEHWSYFELRNYPFKAQKLVDQNILNFSTLDLTTNTRDYLTSGLAGVQSPFSRTTAQPTDEVSKRLAKQTRDHLLSTARIAVARRISNSTIISTPEETVTDTVAPQSPKAPELTPRTESPCLIDFGAPSSSSQPRAFTFPPVLASTGKPPIPIKPAHLRPSQPFQIPTVNNLEQDEILQQILNPQQPHQAVNPQEPIR